MGAGTDATYYLSLIRMDGEELRNNLGSDSRRSDSAPRMSAKYLDAELAVSLNFEDDQQQVSVTDDMYVYDRPCDLRSDPI